MAALPSDCLQLLCFLDFMRAEPQSQAHPDSVTLLKVGLALFARRATFSTISICRANPLVAHPRCWRSAEQHVFRFVDFRGEVVGAAAVGVVLHHQAFVRGADLGFVGAGGDAEHPERFLARHAAVTARTV